MRKLLRNVQRKRYRRIDKIFSEDVSLRDWDNKASGLTKVITINQLIFSDVNSIEVTPLAMYEVKSTVVAELDICVNGNETLLVVDVIEFNNKNEIRAIRAYKG